MIGIVVAGILMFFTILEWAIIIYALMSWFIPQGSSGFSRLLGSFVEPITKPFEVLQQRLFPNLPVDFSPLLAIILLSILRRIIIGVI